MMTRLPEQLPSDPSISLSSSHFKDLDHQRPGQGADRGKKRKKYDITICNEMLIRIEPSKEWYEVVNAIFVSFHLPNPQLLDKGSTLYLYDQFSAL